MGSILFAFAMTISETATWRTAGSSNGDDTTSPFTDLIISVTSSGLSSIKRTIRYLIEDKISDLILKEEIEKKEALEKYGSEGSGKNLPFSSLSEDLKKKEEEKE